MCLSSSNLSNPCFCEDRQLLFEQTAIYDAFGRGWLIATEFFIITPAIGSWEIALMRYVVISAGSRVLQMLDAHVGLMLQMHANTLNICVKNKNGGPFLLVSSRCYGGRFSSP